MKMFRKSASVLLAVLMLLTMLSVSAFAAGKDVTVSFRVEGVEKNLFYGDVTVPAGANVYDVLVAADEKDETLTVVAFPSAYGVYVSAINGETAGTKTEKQWDGWMYRVNDKDPGVGMDQYTVKAGDAVVVYYSDEWGETGMAYPVVNTSRLDQDGVVFFTYTKTVYDDKGNVSTSENILTGYTLYWDGKTITPDKDGFAEIPVSGLKAGDHSVQIKKTAKNGLPEVLRFAPDYTVKTNASFFARIGLFFTRLINTVKNFFSNLIRK